MTVPMEISVRNLGSIRIKKYCPKCLWYLLRIRFQPPFKFSGGIYGDAEKCQKSIIGYLLENDGSLPKAFAPICDCASRVSFPRHWSKFRYQHESGVMLHGVPDEIFVREDGTLCVVDLKTAHARGEDDPFHGQYETQVIGYANIAEKGLRLGKVSMGALLYWDAQVQSVTEDPGAFFKSGRLMIPFDVKPLEVKIDYKMLVPLINEFKSVAGAKSVPDGRTGCVDCKKLDLLLAIEQEMRMADRLLVQQNQDRAQIRRELKQRIEERDDRLRRLLAQFDVEYEGTFGDDSMVACWEYPYTTE